MPFGESTSERIEQVAKAIVDAAYKVHITLGPGLLESVYKTCLAYELTKRGFLVDCERKVPILYDGVTLDADLQLDLLVDDCVIIEVKSVVTMRPVFTAQAITYLKLSGKRLCPLINFNVPFIKDGIKRILSQSAMS